MKKIEWPGIATATGIIFIITIVFAIYRNPTFMLKDWQPLMAACLALFGGTLAYQGAMSKVNWDRELANREVKWRANGVVVRLQVSLLLLRKHAQSAQEHIKKNPTRKISGMPLNGLGHPIGIDIEEAWTNLHLFPRDIAFKIANMRANIAGLQKVIDQHEDRVIRPTDVEAVLNMFERVDKYCTEVLAWTSPDLKDAVV